jgi:hypothetical protein
MVIFVLVLVILFELGFAWDTFKECNKVKLALNGAMEISRQYAERLLILEIEHEQALKSLSNVEELLKRKVAEDNYLRGLLDERGVEWETGWRKL